jgi:hypothetical protein
MRVEVDHNQFVDYVRRGGVWRQQTRPMTAQESVTPERFRLGDWRDGLAAWPVVGADMAAWLDDTIARVAR